MANSILTAVESTPVSFATIKDIRLSYNFNDSVYCGKYYDIYEVVRGGKPCLLYVIKRSGTPIDGFVSSVKELSLIPKAPILPCVFFERELMAYDDIGDIIFYDVVLMNKPCDCNLLNFLNNPHKNYLKEELFLLVKRLSAKIYTLLKCNAFISSFSCNNIRITALEPELILTRNNRFTHVGYKPEDEVYSMRCALVKPLLLLWGMTLTAKGDILSSDELLAELGMEAETNGGIEACKCHFETLDARYGVRLESLYNYLFGGGSYDAVLEAVLRASGLDYNEIEREAISIFGVLDPFNSKAYNREFPVSENRAVVQDFSSGKFGFLDSFGNLIVEPKYDMVTPFARGVSVVSLYGLYYAIDRYGDYITKEGADSLEWISEHECFVCCYEGRFVLLDRASKEISSSYLWIGECSEGIFVVEDEYKKGYVAVSGVEVTPLVYDEVTPFVHGLGRACQDGKWCSVNTYGEVIY